MQRRQILVNALTTFAQVIGSAATLFLLYRFLIRTIGVEKLGIWSLVLATTSLVTLANQGFSTAITKFVAKYAAREQPEEISILIQTAMLSLAAALALLILVFYPAANWALRVILPRAALAEAVAILPFAAASLAINLLGSILQSALAGFELITRRNYIVLAGSTLYLFACFAVVPQYRLTGLAYAQIVQSLACYLAAWFLLRRRLPRFPFFPRRWNRALFRETFSYGAHFQLITASQAVREPVTKALLAKFGGLAATGFYDMALRWVITFREILVQANQVLVPTISSVHERDPASIHRIYRNSYRLMFFLAVPIFAFVGAAGPIVSHIWLGHQEPVFIQFVVLISVGWLINSLGNPAYVVDLGTGALRWVSIGCLLTAVLNCSVGFTAGKFFGGTAVVAASMFSLAVGYIVVIISYHAEYRVPFTDLLPRESRRLFAASLIAATAVIPALAGTYFPPTFSSQVSLVFIALAATLVAIAMWTHPLRKRLQSWY